MSLRNTILAAIGALALVGATVATAHADWHGGGWYGGGGWHGGGGYGPGWHGPYYRPYVYVAPPPVYYAPPPPPVYYAPPPPTLFFGFGVR